MKTWHLGKIVFIALSAAMMSGFLFADTQSFFKSAIANLRGSNRFSIAVGNKDNNYYAIEVQKDTSSSNVSYMLGNLSSDTVKWNKARATAYPGSYPRVAISEDSNNAICFYLNREKYLCYLVGTIDWDQKVVDWNNTTTGYNVENGKTMEFLYSKTNKGIILVSDNRLLVGKVDFIDKTITFGKSHYIGGFNNEPPPSQIKAAIDYDGSKLVCIYKDARGDVIYMTGLVDYNRKVLQILYGEEIQFSQADQVEKIFISPKGKNVVLFCKGKYPLFCLIGSADYTQGTITWDNKAYRNKEDSTYNDYFSIETANSDLQKILKYIKTFRGNTILDTWVSGNITISNTTNVMQHNEEYIWCCSASDCNVVISPDGNKVVISFADSGNEKIL